ncbi:DEAD/DEAH box helicase [Paenibacillus thiaminolyticus]|uniref:DEAD/DEAH box helicase n=1 Tax=Paenibacillus thiaminolyticus TaxID=49283 RepID=A0AAP9DV27_PANTH|nr:DEAD/DEAH box helicase [Paenibacillus thiaminolyticus]MCY9537784.1 DEAD/DEAH box helicase [Paenibacillus thiaminolyticus]MCY9604027.1 DEAD/DEAH box helicase [Paenibacillus thiaminolyticus]MCY9606928.1 DEAD/DEAH box helicase [Paenibacillus thiaminolyticus]MCY9616253.1 DEAD/DEAH box helicase [Paenibacillus thiaminolyticus]MCY9619374.1 DEAD/DEAH box helicase [Paenibacillus thiaminolyticus]
MPAFTLTDVKSFCGSTSYKRGEDYYRLGKVSRLKKSADGCSYTARVKGSSSYSVEVEIWPDGEISTYCDCPAFYSYDNDCKHIAAVLIAIHDQESGREALDVAGSRSTGPAWLNTHRPADNRAAMLTMAEKEAAKYRPAGDLIAHYKMNQAIGMGESSLDSSSTGQGLGRLKFEYTFRVVTNRFFKNPSVMIELRTGVKRLYVVQKVKSFLQSVELAKSHPFTALFTYDPMRHEIGEQDRAMLDLLIQMKHNDEAYREYYSDLAGYLPVTDRKDMFVDPRQWADMLRLLPDVDARLEGLGALGTRMELGEGKLPLQFHITRKTGANYQLDVGELANVTVLPSYRCAMMNGMVYPLDPQEIHKLHDLLTHMSVTQSNGKLDMSEEQLNGFVQHVLPPLRELGQVNIAKPLRERIREPEPQIQLYVDYADGILTARALFRYGAIEIQPLEERQDAPAEQDCILIRDAAREGKLLQRLEAAGLRPTGQRWLSETEDEQYEVLYHLLPVLEKEEGAEIYLSQTLQNIVRHRKRQPKVRADLTGDMNWLDISFELEQIEERELLHIMRSIVEKKKYFRLRDGSFLSLEEEEYQGFADMMESLGMGAADLRGNRIQLPAVRALQLPERASVSGSIRFGRDLRQFVKRFNDLDELDYEVPDGLQAQLRDYQAQGFQWLKMLASYRFGGILADDMGLGKTVQSIAYILSEREQEQESSEEKQPVLIVSPSSLTYNWAQECARFAPQLRVLVVAGQKKERAALWAEMEEADVIVTSYPLLRRDIEFYAEQPFHTLILDEAQAIKNASSQTAQAVSEINAARRFALTGTPIENSLDELWSIFNAVFPGLFTNQKAFRDLPAERVARIVRPFILRRLKKDVLTELPDKIESVQYPELATEQKKLYAAYLAKLQHTTAQDLKTEGFQKSRMKILAGITRLRQLCCHPALFVEGYSGPSGKLQHLLEQVEELTASGRRVLIFSQYSSMLQLIREQLEFAGRTLFYLDGQTPAQERVDMCHRYNAGEAELFLISLKAGGSGLNLTGADTVILYDLWWNPAVEEQAIGRAHRMGQKRVVQVIRLVAEGSIEEKILELQQRKRDLIDEVIDAEGSASSALTEEDIRELLSVT